MAHYRIKEYAYKRTKYYEIHKRIFWYFWYNVFFDESTFSSLEEAIDALKNIAEKPKKSIVYSCTTSKK